MFGVMIEKGHKHCECLNRVTSLLRPILRAIFDC